MTLNYVMITGTFNDGSGGAPGANSFVTFTPNQTAYSSGVPLVTDAAPIVVPITAGSLAWPSGAKGLLATDNTGLSFLSDTGFLLWSAVVTINGQTAVSFSFFLPGFPATVDLFSLANTAVPVSMVTAQGYLTQSVANTLYDPLNAVKSGMFLVAPSVYAPVTLTNLSVTSVSTLSAFSSANINTGNFTAPASGTVVVSANFIINATTSIPLTFGLLDHNLTTVRGMVVTGETSSANIHQFQPVQFVVSGLTPGNTYNFDLAGALSINTDILSIVAIGTQTPGTIGGPVIMTVQAV